MLVLIISAKLLADAEAALQMAPDSSSCQGGQGAAAGLDAASMRQLMGRPDGPPVRYLMTQLTAFYQPLMFPDHAGIMELRTAKQRWVPAGADSLLRAQQCSQQLLWKCWVLLVNLGLHGLFLLLRGLQLLVHRSG
jgi:hypothetical protein